MIGTILADRYRIDSELGRGGMGTVYQGYDLRLNRQVAIKIVSDSGLGTDGRARLLSEAQAAAQLNHPNVVTVYDALENAETPFIVMELVDGRTLRNIPRPNLEAALEYARQICAALAHAHEKGIIHRDLKPENAILTNTGTVKLMDFGLARSSGSPRLTQTGAILGTMAYLAPELIQGREATPQSDLYALGVMLYELLTGRAPFESKDIFQLLAQHLYSPVISPKELNAEIPVALDTLVLRMLSKNPNERPAAARDVEALLAALQTHNELTLPGFLTPPLNSPLPQVDPEKTLMRVDLESDWRKKGYVKASLPMLDPDEKELIFSSRSQELQSGVDHLAKHRLLLITGMPGIGKSTLARALLEFMPAEAPPPFWYDFERQQSCGNTLGVLLDRISGYLETFLGEDVRQELMAFRNSPEGQASAHEVDMLTDFLNQPAPIWLVFDNIETVLSRGGNTFLDADLEMLFNGLKSNTHNARIIIASPFVPVLNDGKYLLEFGTKPLALQGLSEAAAVHCLQAHGLQDFPETTLLSLARSVESHPFALNHVARYVEALGATHAFDHFQGGLEAVSGRFRASLQQRLSPEEFSALQALTVLHREIELEGLRKIAQISLSGVRRLRDEGLLDANETGKFWLPTIVRTTIRPDDPAVLREVHTRAMQYYAKQPPPILRRHIDDYATVLEWHYHALQSGDAAGAYTALFTTGLMNHLKQWNEFDLLFELAEAVRALVYTDPQSLTEKQWVTLHQTLGLISFLLGKYAESVAYLETALEAVTTDNDSLLKTQLLIDLAESLGNLGELAPALEKCQQALNTLPAGQADWLHAKALQIRGILYRNQSDLEQAVRDLEQALEMYEELNDITGIAYVTGELGIVYYYHNQFEQALEYYRRTTRSCEEKRDVRGAMIGHFNAGDILLQQEQYEPASAELQTALELARKRKFPQVEASAGLYLAEAQIALGQLAEAENTLQSLHALLTQQASACYAGQELGLQASLYWQQNSLEAAHDCFERASELLAGEECHYEHARVNLAYAAFLKTLGNGAQARKCLHSARRGFAQVNNALGLQAVEKALAEVEQASK